MRFAHLGWLLTFAGIVGYGMTQLQSSHQKLAYQSLEYTQNVDQVNLRIHGGSYSGVLVRPEVLGVTLKQSDQVTVKWHVTNLGSTSVHLNRTWKVSPSDTEQLVQLLWQKVAPVLGPEETFVDEALVQVSPGHVDTVELSYVVAPSALNAAGEST